jgi:hypothetical protein
MWLVLTNKLLTWDNLEKMNWHGPNCCVLWKLNFESASHFFVSCPYVGQVAMTIKEKFKVGVDWNNINLEECYTMWIQDRSLKMYVGLLCILVANLWWVRNS